VSEGGSIEVRGLDVQIGGRSILGGIDLSLSPGSFLAVIGPNGAGKTTLIRALDGLIVPAAGDVLIEGKPIASMNRKEVARIVGYVPQGDPGGLDFSVSAFVELGRYPHLGTWESPGPADIEVIRVAMEKTAIAHLATRRLGTLSGGERQRVLIAAALAQGGRILLLDEPTSFLDYGNQRRILRLLDDLHRSDGFSCVMVTHDLNAAASLADEVLILKEGKQIAHGRTSTVLYTALLEKIFDVPFDRLVSGDHRREWILPRLEPE